MASHYTQIIGTGSAFPKRVMSNKDFESFLNTSDEWITTRTGIKTRHVADPKLGETTRTLSGVAAKKALEMAKVSPSEIDLIIVGTVTPDSLMPTTANSLQKDLGATKAFSFDLQAACSGFLYGLSIADQYIRTGTLQKALVIGAETLSTIVNWQDRGTCILFGDGAGAAVLQRSADPNHGVIGIKLFSDGTRDEILKLKQGDGVPPETAEHETAKAKICMNGKEIFKLAVRAMLESSEQVLKEAGMAISDVDFFIFHQANIRIIDMCLNALGVPPEKTWLNVDKYGNTSAATLPVCLDEAWKAGRVKPGDTVLMSTFGGGVTWGAALLNL